MQNNILDFNGGRLTPEQYRIRRDATTRSELDRLEVERNSWKIHFARQHEFLWKKVMNYSVYILVVAWALRLTWHLYSGNEYITSSGKDVMYNMPIIQVDPATSQISYHKANIPKDFGLTISPVLMNDTNRQLQFQIRFPYLNSTIFNDQEFEINFSNKMKEVVAGIFPQESKISKNLVDFERQGNKLKVQILFPNNTDTSMMQRAYSMIQPQQIRGAFVRSEDIQELMKDVAGQLVNLEDTHPQVAKKMIHISEGVQNAKQIYMKSSNDFIKEISTALEKTQAELAKDLLLHSGLEKDVDHYRKELQKMQTKLQDTESKLKTTEQQLNDTKNQYSEQIDLLQKQNDEMTQKEKELLEKIQGLQEEVSELEKMRQELELTVKNREEKIEQLEKELQNSVQNSELSKNEIQSTKNQIESLKQQKIILENNLQKIQIAVIQVAKSAGLVLDKLDENQFGQFQNITNQLNDQIISLQSDLNESEEKIRINEKKLLEQSYQLSKSNATIVKQEHEMKQLNQEIFDLTARVKTVQENTDGKEKIILDLQNEKRKLSSDLEKSVYEVTKITVELEQQDSIIKSYRALVNQLRNFAGEIYNQYSSIIEREQNISEDIQKVEVLQQTIKQTMVKEP